MTHEQLMLITRMMPMKTIQVNGEDYLQRYFVGKDDHGNQDWLHRFLRADGERHHHSHPWAADITILCGWYLEEVRRKTGSVFDRMVFEGDETFIDPDRMHRIIDVKPNTWTHMRVYAGREPHWYFIDDNGEKKQMDTSPEDWYLSCKPRQ